MIDQPLTRLDSAIHRLDPRMRVVCALALALFVAFSTSTAVQAAGVATGLVFVAVARLPARLLLRRLFVVNVFLACIWLTVPFARGGEPLAGVELALAVTLKANGVVLLLSALVATIDLVELGHALHHLRVPAKLVHLLLFTVRYFGLIRQEYRRLANAARVRCFRPGTNRRTYRAVGHMLGMLLVKSIDRAERVLAAMKCRGFRGRFYLLDHFQLRRADWMLALLSVVLLGVFGWMEWASPTF